MGSDLLSLKVLHPNNETQTNLSQQLKVLEPIITLKNYGDLEEEFVQGGKQSLTFLTYDDAVRYKTFDRPPAPFDLRSCSFRSPTRQSDVSIDPHGLDDHKKLEFFWLDWSKRVEIAFPEAGATLWSYVKLKRVKGDQESNSDIICSSYIILSKTIEEDKAVIINKICQEYLFAIVSEQFFKAIENTATRAAVAQVMARNMSHNLGSHVLSKLKKESQICTIINAQRDRIGQFKGGLPSLERNEQIANFNEYLKTRMDFVADVTKADPVSESSMLIVTEVIGGLLTNPLLLNRISGIDAQPHYRFAVRVQNQLIPENAKDPAGYTDINLRLGRPANEPRVYAALPNDVLGCHAFYIILENIIRNSYKHTSQHTNGNSNGDSVITFTISLSEHATDKSMIQVDIHDSFAKDVKVAEDLVDKRNEAINKNILENNKLRCGELGTIEMDVCAAYLRKIEIGQALSDVYNIFPDGVMTIDGKAVPNILEARSYPTGQSGESHFGYRFFLLKPREVLVVASLENFPVPDWEGQGVRFVEALENGAVYPHQIVVHTQPLPEKTKGANRNTEAFDGGKLDGDWSDRQLELNAQNLKGLIEDAQGDARKFVRTVWEAYCTHEFARAKGVRFMNKDVEIINLPGKTGGYTEYFLRDHEVRKDAGNINVASVHRLNNPNWGELSNPSVQALQAIETASVDICILDERIQSFAISQSYSPQRGEPVSFREYFEYIGVHIPTRNVIDLNAQNFIAPRGENAESVMAQFKEFFKPSNGQTSLADKCRYIFIHISLMEKMIVEGSKDNKGKIREKLMEIVRTQEIYDKIILISGRGTPDNVPDDCRYYPLSALQNAVETNFDKFLIVQAAYNARRLKL